MLHRLVQLLETLVDLVAIISSHILIHRDKLVKVCDTVMLIRRLVYAMASVALLLALGALTGQMSLQVLARHFDKLASVTRNELLGANFEMLSQVACAHRWGTTLVRTR